MKKPNVSFLKGKKFKHGLYATGVTIIFVAIVVLVNFLFGLIMDRFPATVDLTEDNIYELSDESVKFTKKLKTPTTFYICMDKSAMKNITAYQEVKQAYEIVKSYPKYNSNIKIEYVDLTKNPSFAQKYSGQTINQYSIIVESDKRFKVLSWTEMSSATQDQTTGQTTGVSLSAEQSVSSALAYVTDERVEKVAVLTGHSESESTSLSTLLKSNNYEVSEQDIATSELSEDTTMVVIKAPTVDYTENELKKLDAFLDNNGNFGKTVIYIASSAQPSLPNLEAFLNEWGIQVGTEVVRETDPSNIVPYQGTYLSEIEFASDRFQENLKKDPKLLGISAGFRPLTLAWEEAGNRKATALVETRDSTILMPLDADESFDIDAQPKGAYTVAALGERSRYEGTTELKSSVLVLGSEMFFESLFTSISQYSNGDYIINLVNGISGKQESMNISPVNYTTETLNLTQSKLTAMNMIFVILIPLVCVVLGIVIWIRRRNK